MNGVSESQKNMHILLFTSSFLPSIGGMEYAIHYLAEALIDQGVDVTVMAQRNNKKDNFIHRYRLIRYGISFKGGYRLKINHICAQRHINKLHSARVINIANIHSVSIPPLLSLRALKRLGIPIVMTPHGEDVQRIPEIGYGLRLQPKWDGIIQQHLRAANAVTAISDSIRCELTDVEPHRIFNVPNGIHIKVFGRNPTHFLQESLGLAPETRIILSVGRNHIKKAYAHGIRAMNELVQQHGVQGWHYVLIGKDVSMLLPLVKHFNI